MNNNNKCALEILNKNNLIEIEETFHDFCKDGIPDIKFMRITFFEKNPKFNKELKKILEEEYICWYNKSNYKVSYEYNYVKKEDIIKWIIDLPEKEEIVIPIWDYKFSNFIIDYMKKNIPEFKCKMLNQFSYQQTKMEIRNLKVIEERKKKENEEDEEALGLLDKLF